MLSDGDIFEHNGRRFRVAFPCDDAHEAPWEWEDGHGPVTEAPRRANYHGYISKAPAQRVLGEHWLYDFVEACRIARRDGWGVPPTRMTTERDGSGRHRAVASWGWNSARVTFASEWRDDINDAISEVYAAHRATFPSARAYAAAAAEADYKRLDDWCNDRWHYVGCVVTLLDDDDDATDYTASLWGIESDAGDYLAEVARELADQIESDLASAAPAPAGAITARLDTEAAKVLRRLVSTYLADDGPAMECMPEWGEGFTPASLAAARDSILSQLPADAAASVDGAPMGSN